MKKHVLLLSALLTLAATATAAPAAPLNPVVASWLAAQTNIHTWSADFVQTRTLKNLTQPLTATGHVWFSAPNHFRWELGHPPETIAVRTLHDLLIIYPRLKRVEKYPLTGLQTGPWRDALALLEAGFPRSQAQLLSQYNILSQTVKDGTGHVVLQPKSATARRMIPQITVDFDTRNYSLRATQLQFADGSTMRNDFEHPVLNPSVSPTLFAPKIPPGYQVVEPLKKQ